MKNLIFALIVSAALAGCVESSDSKQNKQQEDLSMRSVESVGLPGITKFQEKRTLKQILELRDKEIATYSYTQDMNGRLHLLCKSVGYGIPYATQYTNPMRYSSQGQGLALPQADPNGLYSPAGADGTWVLCLNQETKQMSPVLAEPRLVVSPFPLAAVQ